jgi:hypothetical protein
MSLWQRAPREVYRVYGEDQYLDGATAPREDAATAEPDGSTEAPWSAFAAAAPPPLTHGGSPARPRGLHAGRLVGFGLLVGVSLATLFLVFVKVVRPHGTTPEPYAREARIEDEQHGHAERMSGDDNPLAVGDKKQSDRMPRFSVSPVVAPARTSGARLQHRDAGADPAPRMEWAWSAASRSPDGEAPAAVAVYPTVQDEFGFEQ